MFVGFGLINIISLDTCEMFLRCCCLISESLNHSSECPTSQIYLQYKESVIKKERNKMTKLVMKRSFGLGLKV